ncbi:MAG: 4Fe-4S dicluster domain-containing protein [Clostridia bacterium]|nr:4Fe-4S dicluster domain-containing protein [Clostridia bacterium]
MYFLKKDRHTELFDALSADSALYLPIKDKNGKTNYAKYTAGAEYSDALNTERSAKDFFFPQTEDLVDFKMDGKNIEVIDIRKPSEDYVVFGVRACDMASFDILDSVYLSDPVDSYYAERRSHATVMAMACSTPSETCFCRTFGIDPAKPAGDVACAMTDSGLYLDPLTEKGEALVAKISGMLEETDGKEAEEQGKRCHEIMDKLPLANLTPDSFGGERMMEHFSSEKWASLSEACLGCGTCTFVCPTCQCYDIRDFDTGHGIKRFRCWDSCMYSDFTKMAHGNSRNSQLERFRQRFMHKLVYYPANNDGKFGCVGCGRCLSKCPISMNIVKVMKALEEA